MHATALLSGLGGYRGGPQDAFRHSLASAYVSKYLSPNIVDFFTQLSESNSGSDHDLMDRHNNALGRDIGKESNNIYQDIFNAVKNGQEGASDKSIITWLPSHRWTDFLDFGRKK
jgi:hypothetical protein